METTRTLIVDGANVVGSRPNGWWRDRPGAAARLHAALVTAATGWQDEVVLVLEGAAVAGVEEGTVGRVRTVHAAGSGDDRVVEEVTAAAPRGSTLVVTADRGLADRVRAVGAEVEGPRVLLARLDRDGSGRPGG